MVEIHDVHAWALGSKEAVLTAHVVVADGSSLSGVHDQLADMLDTKFEIEHATLQVEAKSDSDHGAREVHS